MVKFKYEKLYAVSLGKYLIQFNELGFYETDNEEIIELLRWVGKYEEIKEGKAPKETKDPTPQAADSTSDKTVEQLRVEYKDKFCVKANGNRNKATLLEELAKDPTPPAAE